MRQVDFALDPVVAVVCGQGVDAEAQGDQASQLEKGDNHIKHL